MNAVGESLRGLGEASLGACVARILRGLRTHVVSCAHARARNL